MTANKSCQRSQVLGACWIVRSGTPAGHEPGFEAGLNGNKTRDTRSNVQFTYISSGPGSRQIVVTVDDGFLSQTWLPWLPAIRGCR